MVKPSAKATITNFFTKLRLPRQWRSVDDIKKAFDNQTFELPKVKNHKWLHEKQSIKFPQYAVQQIEPIEMNILN